MDIEYKSWLAKQVEREREAALDELRQLSDRNKTKWFHSKHGRTYLKIISQLERELRSQNGQTQQKR